MIRLFTAIVCISFVFSIPILSQTFDEWETIFEKSNHLETAGYNETITYFQRFESFSPYIKMRVLGETPQKRQIYYLVVTKGKEFTPELAKKSGKCVVLVQNGIHAGEIEGKDACMILLREMLVSKEKEYLLDNNIFIIIPVINVDGHERISKYNRINQNGPVNMGWRTTAQNLNLNRDFMKADAPEMQAFLKFYNAWLPDFFIDSHTTDGADYQYTVTYSVENHENIYRNTGKYLRKEFIPYFENYLKKDGYLASPYVSFKDGKIANGIADWVAMPRLSNGYAAVQNRPSLLIETHMLKPYKERVFSTKSAVCAVLEFTNRNFREIKTLNQEADQTTINELASGKKALPLVIKNTGKNPDMFSYKGFKEVYDSSWITGQKIIRYTGEMYTIDIPYYNKVYVADSVFLPEKYIIPVEWTEVIQRLDLHGINYNIVQNKTKYIAEKVRFSNVKFAVKPYEGRLQPDYEIRTFTDTVLVNPGDCIVDTRQRTVRIIGALLEAKSPDSFLKWGFFNAVFEQKEYFEDYSMEPVAEKMSMDNPGLKKEFLKKIEEDEKFRNSAYERLNFFYERSPYFDNKFNVYPVMRIIKDLSE